jgi:exonuclease SbcD
MKILHTADWHIGQLFYEYDRTYEHKKFLDWLLVTIKQEQIDVLLISGDVFDISNPAASSVKLFYTFLNEAVKANAAIQIIITAGNHDSASRLESPKPLLESSRIHIVGLVEKNVDNEIDYEKLIIPIQDNTGTIKAWCLAIPFLRMGDYPAIADCANPYTEGVAALYQAAYQYALNKKQDGQVIIAMGHLHTQHAEVTDLDKTERVIMGGVEYIPSTAFHQDIAYVALGHIHKAQRIGGKESVRYSGSPLPMSFSELNYKHQVIIFELTDGNINTIQSIEVPLSVELKRIPSVHSSLTEVLSALAQLLATDTHAEAFPYLEVRVLLDSPEPGLRHKIQTALAGKHVRLAKIDVRYPVSSSADSAHTAVVTDQLNALQPKDLFAKLYQSKYKTTVPEEMLQLFLQVSQEIGQSE